MALEHLLRVSISMILMVSSMNFFLIQVMYSPPEEFPSQPGYLCSVRTLFNYEERILLYSIKNHPWIKMENFDQHYKRTSEIVKINPVREKYNSYSTLPQYRKNPISVPSANVFLFFNLIL